MQNNTVHCRANHRKNLSFLNLQVTLGIPRELFGKLRRACPRIFDIQVDAVMRFIETLPPGRHQFTSTSGSLKHYIGQNLSRNWFFAVGSYSTWGKGVAEISSAAGKLNFAMSYEYHFVDRYNWDGGKQVEIPIPGYGQLPQLAKNAIDSWYQVNNGRLTVTDEFMARFHRQGLAQEFEMTAVINERFVWRPTSGYIEYTVKPGDTLSKLAGIYLGDINRWPDIHKLNQSSIPNPNVIRVGQVIRIPAEVDGGRRIASPQLFSKKWAVQNSNL